jgi:hypothetical protein
MRKIVNRLEKLEKVFARVAASATIWGSMAKFRDRLLQLAKHRDASSVAALREELERLGPAGLWLETARCYLRDHGFVQTGNESLGGHPKPAISGHLKSGQRDS